MSARVFLAALALGAVLPFGANWARADAVGPFDGQNDVGAMKPQPGSATFDSGKKALTLSAGGANIWAAEDDFHFVWKKASGDVTLAANLDFAPATAGAIVHRKAVVMIRQSLDQDSPYADACVHGNGMTALQWRDEKGVRTFEIEARANAPKRLRIEKRGDYFSMSIGTSDADLQPAGGSCKVALTGDYYIGVGLCSHSIERMEQATFSDIEQGTPEKTGAAMISTLEVLKLGSNLDRKVIYTLKQPGATRFEAPNWSPDNMLYFNNHGHLSKIAPEIPGNDPSPVGDIAKPEQVDLGILTNLNNDHTLSHDGKFFALSDQSQPNAQGKKESTVWTIPVQGPSAGAPKRITPNTPSYGHGWSPDGKMIVFTGDRDNVWEIYSAASDGSTQEKRLTNGPGRSDGPEFSPDGKWIYFNSDRTKQMQIWRMNPDGTGQEQVTPDDGRNNWFPHISPDGKQMVFVSFESTVRSDDHPESKDVMLKLMDMQSKKITTVAKVFGGQGTINVPSWSPDSQSFAFVSYLKLD